MDKRKIVDWFERLKKLKKLRRDDSNLLLHVNLKSASTKKVKVKVFAKFQGDYVHILADPTMKI